MALTKRYLKNKPMCKVCFKLDKKLVEGVSLVNLVGDFNDWTADKTPMKKLKDGGFSVTVDLPVGRDYQFRYFIDGTVWENDNDADRYEYSPFGNCENSVVSV